MTKLLEGTCAAPVKTDLQWDFTYDGDGTRTRQVVTTFDRDTQAITGTSITAHFMGGLYEETDGVARKYYAMAGMTLAVSDASGLKFLLTDHLGSVAAVTDSAGALLDQQRYMPFGAVRENIGTITQTDLGYTGQRDLSLMGLMDYKARFYDAGLGRFIQPDTIIPNAADPQGWNRYAYVRNAPLRYTDPTGHFLVEDDECTQLSCSGDPEHPKKTRPIKKEDDEESVIALGPSGGEEGCAGAGIACELPPHRPNPHNDQNPNVIRLWGVWQPRDDQTLNPLGKGAILAFGAIALGELYALGGESATMGIGIPILVVAVWLTMSWWNFAQTPEW